jgi:hypothetical protein
MRFKVRLTIVLLCLIMILKNDIFFLNKFDVIKFFFFFFVRSTCIFNFFFKSILYFELLINNLKYIYVLAKQGRNLFP